MKLKRRDENISDLNWHVWSWNWWRIENGLPWIKIYGCEPISERVKQ